jgi:hypothetical protein
MGQNIRYAGEKNANYKDLTQKVDKTLLSGFIYASSVYKSDTASNMQCRNPIP